MEHIKYLSISIRYPDARYLCRLPNTECFALLTCRQLRLEVVLVDVGHETDDALEHEDEEEEDGVPGQQPAALEGHGAVACEVRSCINSDDGLLSNSTNPAETRARRHSPRR